MPAKKRTTMSQKTSVVITKQVMQSRMSAKMTGLKTVSHKRSASGEMVESWSSPTLALTSPQTWVSGPQAKFLSPPSKTPSPKRRITRRSSVYVNPAWAAKSVSKASPTGADFKIPISAITRTRQNSFYHKSSEEFSSRRSSVYTKSSKLSVSKEQVELEQDDLKVKDKSSKSKSPKVKKSKLPLPPTKKLDSPKPSKGNRKRNVSELEKEESPDKPAAKRRKGVTGEVSDTTPKKASKMAKKTSSKISSPPAAGRKEPKNVARTSTAKTAKSPSPRKARTTKSTRSPASQKKSKSAKNETKNQKMANLSINNSALENVKQTKEKTKNDTPKQSRKRKAENDDSDQQTPKQKAAKVSPNAKLGSSSKSKTKKSKKMVMEETSLSGDPLPSPVSKATLLESGKKSDKKKSKTRTPGTAKSTPKVKRQSLKLSASSKKTSLRKGAEQVESGVLTSPGVQSPAQSKKKSETPKLKTKTPASNKKTTISKSRAGKSSPSKSPTKNATPKSAVKKKGKSHKSSTRKSTTGLKKKMDVSDSLDGSYLEVAEQQIKNTSQVTSTRKGKSKTGNTSRSEEDEKIMEILKQAVASTPKSRKSLSTPKPRKISTPKTAKSSIKQTTQESPDQSFMTPKSQKTTKSTSKKATLSQKSLSSSVSKKPSSKKTPALKTPKGRAGKTQLNRSQMSSASKRKKSNILIESDQFNEYQLTPSLGRQSERELSVAQASSLQAQTYRKDKSFSQFVEYRANSAVERYGAQAVERTVGGQTYRKGAYHVERSRGDEVEVEEEEWEGDANNSALSISDDPNATINTASNSGRCTIL